MKQVQWGGIAIGMLVSGCYLGADDPGAEFRDSSCRRAYKSCVKSKKQDRAVCEAEYDACLDEAASGGEPSSESDTLGGDQTSGGDQTGGGETSGPGDVTGGGEAEPGDGGEPQEPEVGPPFFTAAAWLWNKIPTNPVLDSQSSSIVGRLSSGKHVAAIFDYGVPIYHADASTPRYSVDCTVNNWGTCALEQESVPLFDWMKPSPGTDGAMVVIDWSTGKSYEFWQYSFNGGNPLTSFGAIADLWGEGHGAATGAGFSRLAGVVTTQEMESGYIPHALIFSTDSACPDVFRYPAVKTDGWNLSGSSVCVEEGTRLQLDPSIDVDALPGLTPGERTVARALQEFGAYAMDNGGARMAIIFETPYGNSDPYPGVGFGWDYFDMANIPWTELRVLRQWDGN